tara:strand:+ start:982 stop:1479 length:498 start_codon:yes stop_codon:yes gene_type:complete
MKKLVQKIKNLLNEQDNSTYKEVYNFNYEIEVDTDFMNKKIPPALEADEIEREELIRECEEVCVRRGIGSRQCVVHKKYQDDNTLTACLSTIQAIARNNKIDLHVFVRSQNFDKNFCYDNQTYMKIMDHLCWVFPNYVHQAEYGKIYVHITSLHRLCGEDTFTFC